MRTAKAELSGARAMLYAIGNSHGLLLRPASIHLGFDVLRERLFAGRILEWHTKLLLTTLR